MKILVYVLSLVLIVCNVVVYADTLYRWVDKEGKVHYGDKPAEDAVNTEQKKFGASAAQGDDELSYGIRKAKQDFPVTLYVASNCGEYCVQARALLNKRGVPFVEKNLVTKEEVDAFKTLTGGDRTPTLMVGKTPLKGFQEGQWSSELDIAGYPKIVPYGTRPAQPAVAKPEATPATDK
jgi:glutaredoxin